MPNTSATEYQPRQRSVEEMERLGRERYDMLARKAAQSQITAVVFERQFTAGALCGVSLIDGIKFVSRDRAASWLRGIRRNIRLGRLPYTIRLLSVASNI